MKKIFSVIFVILLVLALDLTAQAAETSTSDSDDEEGFTIEELPEFGEGEELIFPEEEVLIPEPTIQLTTAPEPVEETNAKEKTDEIQLDEENVVETAPQATEEAETVSSKQNNYPVIIIVAVLAVCAILFAIVNKRKPTKRRNG